MIRDISNRLQKGDADRKDLHWSFTYFDSIAEFMEIFRFKNEMDSKRAMRYTGKQRMHVAVLFGVTKYLGLLESPRRGIYRITDIGRKFLAANEEEKKKIFCELIKRYDQFNFALEEYKRNPKITKSELGELIAEEYQRDWSKTSTMKNARVLHSWIEMYIHFEKKTEKMTGSKPITTENRRSIEKKDLYKEIGVLETYIKTGSTQDEIDKELQKISTIAESLNLEKGVSMVNLMKKHLKMKGIDQELLLSDLETLYNEILD